MNLDTDLVSNIRINLSAIERRTSTLTKRRSVKKEYQAAWLLKAISLIDLTTLSGDDTAGKVERLCEKAKSTPGTRDTWIFHDFRFCGMCVCFYRIWYILSHFLHFLQKYRCVSKIGFPANIFTDIFIHFHFKYRCVPKFGFSADISIDICIDISIDNFIDILTDICIDIFISIDIFASTF